MFFGAATACGISSFADKLGARVANNYGSKGTWATQVARLMPLMVWALCCLTPHTRAGGLWSVACCYLSVLGL